MTEIGLPAEFLPGLKVDSDWSFLSGGTRGHSTFLQCDIETPLRWKTETDRIREGISEGYRSAEPERVVPGGV